DAIEAVIKSEHALNLVRLNHRRQHVGHLEPRAAARKIISDRENSAEIVGRVSPLGREPRVVEVEPANHRTDVERRGDGVELVARAGYARAAVELGAWND